jgi:hypothetical protein
MIAQLLGPITNIVGSIVSGKMEQKAAETKAKVAKAHAIAGKTSGLPFCFQYR